MSRFRSSQALAAHSRANFGIKGTLADSNVVFGFEAPMRSSLQIRRSFKSTTPVTTTTGVDSNMQPAVAYSGLRASHPRLPPVNVVSPEPRLSPGRGSLFRCLNAWGPPKLRLTNLNGRKGARRLGERS